MFLARFPDTALSSDAKQGKAVFHERDVKAFQVTLRPKLGGWPLPRDVQTRMEVALGASFSDVRIHIGPEPGLIGASAFTWGSDVYFAPGTYNPHTPQGQFLLAHELTHVVQQRAGRVVNPFGSGVAVVQDHRLEAEADRLGRDTRKYSRQIFPTLPRIPISSSTVPSQVRQISPSDKCAFRITRSLALIQRCRFSTPQDDHDVLKVERIEKFLAREVSPWATQARIAARMNPSIAELELFEELEPRIGPTSVVFPRRPRARKSNLKLTGLEFLPSTTVPLPKTDSKQKRKNFIHRDVPEIERIGGTAYVRIYHTGSIKQNSYQQGLENPKIWQDESRNIRMKSGDLEKVFWMGGGTPLRQLEWAEKKPIETPGSIAVISSFLVPSEGYNKITRCAVPEQLKKERGGNDDDVRNVDMTGAPNQYGIKGPAKVALLGIAYFGSLITYVERPELLKGTAWGQVRSIDELRQKLRAPRGIGLVGASGMARTNIWVNDETCEFLKSAYVVPSQLLEDPKRRIPYTISFARAAEEYANILGLWIGSQQGRGSGLLNERFRHIPSREYEQHRHVALKEFLVGFGYDLPENWRELARRTQERRRHLRDRYLRSARAFERRLGIYLSTNQVAIQAASEMCNRLWALFNERKRSDIEKFALDPKSSGAIGTDKFALSLIPAQGNLREQLTWVLAATHSEKDERGGQKWKPIAEELLEYPLPHMQRPKNERRRKVESTEERQTTQRPLDVQYPPLSYHEEGYAVSKGKLQWEPGSRSIRYPRRTGYLRKAWNDLRLVAAGTSGTAFRMISVAHALGLNLQHVRLALLTWMLTVGDHTFDEIMEGCAVFGRQYKVPGLEYNERRSPSRYRSIPPLTEYELRRFVCENDTFPDELLEGYSPAELRSGALAFR